MELVYLRTQTAWPGAASWCYSNLTTITFGESFSSALLSKANLLACCALETLSGAVCHRCDGISKWGPSGAHRAVQPQHQHQL